MINDGRKDVVMITQDEYKSLRDTATRVTVLLDMIKAHEYTSIEDVLLILDPGSQLPEVKDDLAEALAYTD